MRRKLDILTLTLLNRNICAQIVDTRNKVFPNL